MALKRLRGLSISTIRQLFVASIASTVDYASNVWTRAGGVRLIKAIDRVQRIGAQAIIGAFSTVAMAVAEVEAGILTAQERFARRAAKLWINLRTLPKSHPLRRIGTYSFRRFISPPHQIAAIHQKIPVDRLETIYPFTLAPWEEQLQKVVEEDDEKVIEAANAAANAAWAVRIATSSSAKNDLVGLGWTIQLPESYRWGGTLTYSSSRPSLPPSSPGLSVRD
jgi:hypothetical protein